MKKFRIKSSDEIKASVCCATTGRFLAQLYDSGFSTIRGVQYSLLTKIPHTSAKELGKEAFKNNKPTAPIYCNEIMQIVYTNRDLGVKLMKSYIDGWHIENLRKK